MTILYLEVPLKDIEKSPIKSMLSVRRQVVAESISHVLLSKLGCEYIVNSWALYFC